MELILAGFVIIFIVEQVYEVEKTLAIPTFLQYLPTKQAHQAHLLCHIWEQLEHEHQQSVIYHHISQTHCTLTLHITESLFI